MLAFVWSVLRALTACPINLALGGPKRLSDGRKGVYSLGGLGFLRLFFQRIAALPVLVFPPMFTSVYGSDVSECTQ